MPTPEMQATRMLLTMHLFVRLAGVATMNGRMYWPFPQSRESCGFICLVPPDNLSGDRADSEPAKSAHEQPEVLLVLLKRVEDAEQQEAGARNKPGEHGDAAQSLTPGGIVGEPVEAGRVADMVDRVYGADKADGGEGAADNEDRLELEGGYVADEGDVRVDLAGVAWAAEVEPAQEEDGEGAKPRERGNNGEVVQALVRVHVEGGELGARHWGRLESARRSRLCHSVKVACRCLRRGIMPGI